MNRHRFHAWPRRILLGLVLGLATALFSGPDTCAAEKDRSSLDPLPAVFSKRVPESIDELKTIERHVEKVLARLTPSIVCVRIGNSSGTGVIVTKDGHVLTAGHVSVSPGRDCKLIFPDGKTAKGKTLGCNRGVDSGMIKIVEETDKGWPFVEMGSSAQLKPGDWCIARGHPGGFKKGRDPVVRVGRILKTGTTTLVHDCALVGGDSGGPLFDMTGKVVAIESRIGQALQANMAVPVDVFRNSWDQLASAQAPGGGTVAGGEALFPLGYIVPAYVPTRPITANGFGAEKAALGPHPNVILFAREVSEPLATLARRVDELARDKDAPLDSFVVLVVEGKEPEAKLKEELEAKLKELVGKNKLQNTTLSVEQASRVEGFRISKVSDITVLAVSNGAARGVYTFKVQDFRAESGDKLLADLKRIVEEWKARQ